MNDELEYRAVLAVDIERSAGRGDRALLEIRARLTEMLKEAFEASGVDWSACLRHDLGDGLRVTAPAGTRKAALVHPLVPELALRLRTYNRGAGPLTRIRVRIALHAGDVHVSPDGTVAGSPLEVLARLLDAPPARAALAGAPKTVPASLLLSGHFYDETVRHGHLGLFPEDFRKVGFTVKEHTADAWLQLPGRQPPAEAAPEPADAQEEPAGSETAGSKTAGSKTAGSKMVNKASGHGVVYATQHGTQHIRIERKH
ncbi:hypothetical protein [Streptomyces griseofuscus]|uniref:hypothetical protein n=1 Tax=Streptomyces griseofuscus TaxID=146922 RepID=UPI00118C8644|nr:hypothetical protein SRO_4810 [Streptomyces rochei]